MQGINLAQDSKVQTGLTPEELKLLKNKLYTSDSYTDKDVKSLIGRISVAQFIELNNNFKDEVAENIHKLQENDLKTSERLRLDDKNIDKLVEKNEIVADRNADALAKMVDSMAAASRLNKIVKESRADLKEAIEEAEDGWRGWFSNPFLFPFWVIGFLGLNADSDPKVKEANDNLNRLLAKKSVIENIDHESFATNAVGTSGVVRAGHLQVRDALDDLGEANFGNHIYKYGIYGFRDSIETPMVTSMMTKDQVFKNTYNNTLSLVQKKMKKLARTVQAQQDVNEKKKLESTANSVEFDNLYRYIIQPKYKGGLASGKVLDKMSSFLKDTLNPSEKTDKHFLLRCWKNPEEFQKLAESLGFSSPKELKNSAQAHALSTTLDNNIKNTGEDLDYLRALQKANSLNANELNGINNSALGSLDEIKTSLNINDNNIDNFKKLKTRLIKDVRNKGYNADDITDELIKTKTEELTTLTQERANFKNIALQSLIGSSKQAFLTLRASREEAEGVSATAVGTAKSKTLGGGTALSRGGSKI
jgi:hypothetical protein